MRFVILPIALTCLRSATALPSSISNTEAQTAVTSGPPAKETQLNGALDIEEDETGGGYGHFPTTTITVAGPQTVVVVAPGSSLTYTALPEEDISYVQAVVDVTAVVYYDGTTSVVSTVTSTYYVETAVGFCTTTSTISFA